MPGQYLGGVRQPGTPIVWKGEYEGKVYVDKGEIVEVKPNRLLKVTHVSPLSGWQMMLTALKEFVERG